MGPTGIRPTRGPATRGRAAVIVTSACAVAMSLPTSMRAQEPSADGSASRDLASIGTVAFLAGCWEGGSGDIELREQWSEPAGGVMLGTTRYLRDGRVVDFEFAMLEETDGAVTLWPYPGGERSAHGFPLVAGDGEIVFENPEHDFPVRIIYRRVGPDDLAPRIEGRDGEARGWELRRVACPS